MANVCQARALRNVPVWRASSCSSRASPVPCTPAPHPPAPGRTQVPNFGEGHRLTCLIPEPLNLEPGLWPRRLEPMGRVLDFYAITLSQAPGPGQPPLLEPVCQHQRTGEGRADVVYPPTLCRAPLFWAPRGTGLAPSPPRSPPCSPPSGGGFHAHPLAAGLASPFFAGATRLPLLFSLGLRFCLGPPLCHTLSCFVSVSFALAPRALSPRPFPWLSRPSPRPARALSSRWDGTLRGP